MSYAPSFNTSPYVVKHQPEGHIAPLLILFVNPQRSSAQDCCALNHKPRFNLDALRLTMD